MNHIIFYLHTERDNEKIVSIKLSFLTSLALFTHAHTQLLASKLILFSFRIGFSVISVCLCKHVCLMLTVLAVAELKFVSNLIDVVEWHL